MDWSVTHYPAGWGGKKLVYPEVRAEHPKFSQSIAVGNLVFVSGCVGADMKTGRTAPDDVAEQVKLALTAVKTSLEAAGSSMENIVKTFFLIRNLDDYPNIRQTETEFYEEHAPALIGRPPSATLMVVPGLARPEFNCEYEVIAVKDPNAADWGVTYYPEYWGGKELAYPHVPKDHAKFARTQVAGEWVAVSGCQALDHDTVRVETMDFAEQTRICLEKVRIGMEETGGSLATVAKNNIFLKDPAMVGPYRAAERAYYAEKSPAAAANPPASTIYIVEELPRPVFLVEIESFGVANTANPNWTMGHVPGSGHSAAAVTAGKLVYLSGQDGAGAGDIGAEVTAAFDKVRTALTAAGSSMDKIIKCELMLTDPAHYGAMRQAELSYYQRHAPTLVANPPTSTFLQVLAMETPGAQFQVDVTAVK